MNKRKVAEQLIKIAKDLVAVNDPSVQIPVIKKNIEEMKKDVNLLLLYFKKALKDDRHSNPKVQDIIKGTLKQLKSRSGELDKMHDFFTGTIRLWNFVRDIK